MALPIKKQIDYALFLAAGQDDPHSVTITELCATIAHIKKQVETLTKERDRYRAYPLGEHAKVLLDALARAKAAEAERDRLAADNARLRALIEYWCQDNTNTSGPRLVDIGYTAFMAAHQPNSEDGGPSDWMTDTKPGIMQGIEKMRLAALAGEQ